MKKTNASSRPNRETIHPYTPFNCTTIKPNLSKKVCHTETIVVPPQFQIPTATLCFTNTSQPTSLLDFKNHFPLGTTT